MHPLARAATMAAVLAALATLDRGPPPPPPTAAPLVPRGTEGLPAPCAEGTLPEGPVCIRIPRADEREAPLEGVAAPSRGEIVPERIPRRPERPADAAAYLYPAGASGDAGPRILVGGARPGVRVAVRPGEAVRAVALEHQVGPAEVVLVGDLYGLTVATAHTLDEPGGRTWTVLLLHGGLDRVAPGIAPGARVEAGAELGFARTELGAGLLDVYVEARELREGKKLDGDGKHMVDPAVSMATDVRNALPLR